MSRLSSLSPSRRRQVVAAICSFHILIMVYVTLCMELVDLLQKRKLNSRASLKRKRKEMEGQADESISKILAELKELVPVYREFVEVIARAFGESEKHCTMRRDLLKNLEKMKGLTRSQMILACMRLSNDSADLQCFYDLESEEDKMILVLDVLKN